jgi:hypothetical protein
MEEYDEDRKRKEKGRKSKGNESKKENYNSYEVAYTHKERITFRAKNTFCCLLLLNWVSVKNIWAHSGGANFPRTRHLNSICQIKRKACGLICTCIEVDNKQPATTGQGECWHACRPLMNMTTGHDMLLLLDDAVTGNANGLATLGWDAFRTRPVWILTSIPQSAWWSACRP